MARKDSKFKVGTLVRSVLMANPGVSALVGSNIYPCVAPEGTDSDYIIYFRDKYAVDKTKFGKFQQAATVMIVVISNDYERSQDIADAIDEALSGIHEGTDFSLEDSTEDYVDKKYTQFLLFKIV